MSDSEPGFSVDDAYKVQGEMRRALGLGPERFPMPAFIGMLSDEIEQLRAKGQSDDEIAAMISAHASQGVNASDVAEHYVPPEERQRG